METGAESRKAVVEVVAVGVGIMTLGGLWGDEEGRFDTSVIT